MIVVDLSGYRVLDSMGGGELLSMSLFDYLHVFLSFFIILSFVTVERGGERGDEKARDRIGLLFDFDLRLLCLRRELGGVWDDTIE